MGWCDAPSATILNTYIKCKWQENDDNFLIRHKFLVTTLIRIPIFSWPPQSEAQLLMPHPLKEQILSDHHNWMNLFATAIIKNINKKKFHVPKRLYKILRFIKRIPVNHSKKYLAMWKYRLDFKLSYYVLFVNIGFVFCTLEHHCKQYDEIWCIDGTWILAQNG